jgi:hypothetical protein
MLKGGNTKWEFYHNKYLLRMQPLSLFCQYGRINDRRKTNVNRRNLECVSARDYELVRNQVELTEIIGEGQFGDVHKGTFKGRDNQVIPVAVKTCKADADLATAEKFLEEACKCSLFCSPLCYVSRSKYSLSVNISHHRLLY